MTSDDFDDYLDDDDEFDRDRDDAEPDLDDYGTEGNLALRLADDVGGFRRLGDVLNEVILACAAAYAAQASDAVVVPMIRPTIEPPTNDPDQELCFHVCLGQPPIRQKSIVLKLYEHGKIGPETAEIVLNALGIGAA